MKMHEVITSMITHLHSVLSDFKKCRYSEFPSITTWNLSTEEIKERILLQVLGQPSQHTRLCLSKQASKHASKQTNKNKFLRT